MVETFLGNGSSVAREGYRTNATISISQALAFDNYNNLYVGLACSIYKVNNETGYFSLFSGNNSDCSYANGNLLEARYSSIFAITFHKNSIYIADYKNLAIRLLNLTTGNYILN